MKYFVALTGASGHIYAKVLIEQLCAQENTSEVAIAFTDTAKLVCHQEREYLTQGCNLLELARGKVPAPLADKVKVFDNRNFFTPSASGSNAPDKMIVVPCSMGSLARIANGLSNNLIERTADVMIKENKQLVFVPREAPLSKIHLSNMLKLMDFNVTMIPPISAFYLKPQSYMDFANYTVGKILDAMNIKHCLYIPWQSDLTAKKVNHENNLNTTH